MQDSQRIESLPAFGDDVTNMVWRRQSAGDEDLSLSAYQAARRL